MFMLCSTISAAVSGRLGARTNFPPHIVNEGNGMGYLKLVILVLAYALITPAFAHACCPAGCAPEADRCVTTGPLWTRCIPIPCADGSRRPSAGSSSGPTREHRKSAVLARPLRTARTYVAPRQIPPECPLMNPTKAQVDEATNQCVNALTGSAQFRGCFFEDDAGRSEDKRTGLSCPDRQAALAKQCLKRCGKYASDTTHLRYSAMRGPPAASRAMGQGGP